MSEREKEIPEGAIRHERESDDPTARCPFCRSDDTEVISLFGSQVMTMQCKCRTCGSFFEASKY